jgi:hypothetical protein
MNAEELDAYWIEQQLLDEVRAARGHDRFSGNSAIDLVQLIHAGAQRMVAGGRTSRDDIDEARVNVRLFLDEMEEGRLELGYSEFHEDNVERARSLCRFWPVCQ